MAIFPDLNVFIDDKIQLQRVSNIKCTRLDILQEKIDLIHEQVIRGDKNQVYKLLDKKGWANARDHYGHSALHKSVMANQGDIMKFLLHHHPEHIEDRDNV